MKRTVNLAPSAWSAADRAKFWDVQADPHPANPQASGRNGVVATAYNGYAARAGLEALRQGGSSVDAALATALAQIALDAGAAISFAGIMTLIHYDAASGRSSVMNACWNTVRGETDPLSIAGLNFHSMDGIFSGAPSGRTALVPGFMKGVEAAHGRFGRLPFDSLFGPAIEIAEDGFDVYADMAWDLERRQGDLARLPETRAVFFKDDGAPYRLGDRFRQTALAQTLRRVAGEGADYMYRGPWAGKLVEAVQRDGGCMTLEDLAAYDVIWSEPLVSPYGAYELHVPPGPGLGGVNLVEALNLAEAADIAGLGHWSSNPESFRRLVLATTPALPISYMPADVLAALLPGMDLSPAARTTKDHARELWLRLEGGLELTRYRRGHNHSDVVVAADASGDLTAVCQSINCVMWGKTAINVDGVSIGDPAAHQQSIIAATGPGRRLPDPTSIGLVTRGGAPVLAFSSMGSGLHHKTVQCLINSLDFGMDPKAANDAPSLLFPHTTSPEEGGETIVRVPEGDFDPALLEATGLAVAETPIEELRLAQGLWVGVARDAAGELKACSPPHTSGQAVAY